MSVEGISMQFPMLMSEAQHESFLSQCSLICSVIRCQNLAPSVETPTHKGEVSFEQCVFEVRSVIQNHAVVAIVGGNSMVFTCRATADLVQYLDPQALVAEIINKLELVYGTVASFDILMQNLYKLHQG